MAQEGVSVSKSCSLWGKHFFSQSIIPSLPLDRRKDVVCVFSPCYSEPIMKNGFKSILRRKKSTSCKGLISGWWEGLETGKEQRDGRAGVPSPHFYAACHILGKIPPQTASENWIAGLFLIIHRMEQRNGKSFEHLQWAQQWVLTAECSWCLESSPEFSPAPSWSTDLK